MFSGMEGEVMDDWRKECGVLQDWEYSSDRKLYMAGRQGMRTAGVIAMAKAIPGFKVVVKDIATLDMLVASGVKPSQIILTSEYNESTEFGYKLHEGAQEDFFNSPGRPVHKERR